MNTTTATLTSQFTPAAADVDRITPLVKLLNEELRAAHQTGAVVLVSEDHVCKTGEHPCPQVRVAVRAPEDAVSRPEVVDA